MRQGCKIAVQLDFGRSIHKAEKIEKAYTKTQPETKLEECPVPPLEVLKGIIMYVHAPRCDDCFDDDEDNLVLYGYWRTRLKH